LEEDKGEVSTSRITGKDNVLRLHGLVPRAGWRIEKGEIGDEGIKEGRGEGMLRGETVADA
jgi:hypothetical protein